MKMKHFMRSQSGAAAVEFALASTFLLAILAGGVDVGMAIFARINAEHSVSAAGNYSILHAGDVTSSGSEKVAQVIGTILTNNGADADVSGSVIVNNGPKAVITAGTLKMSGTASKADSCYCPSLEKSAIKWGSSMTCGSTCTGGGFAGKFVEIDTQVGYTPLFSTYGLVDGSIAARAFVQVQ